MKAPPISFRREFAFVGGITLLALVPVFFLWRKSVVGQTHQLPGLTASGLTPVVARMTPGKTSQAIISPDGRWLARMEVPAQGTPSPPNTSVRADELVIRSTHNGQEIFRATAVGWFVGWIPGSVAFVAIQGDSINVFAPTVRTPNGTSPKQPWTQKTISFAPPCPDRWVRFD